MPLITSFGRIAAKFSFVGTGSGASDPGTWTPSGLPSQLPNSLYALIACCGAKEQANTFGAAFVFPAGWTKPVGQPAASSSSSTIAWRTSAVPASAITWTVGPSPTRDFVLIMIVEYLAGTGALVRDGSGAQNSPGPCTGGAAGFGNNMDDIVAAFMSQNDAHDPTVETWSMAGSGGGWQQDAAFGPPTSPTFMMIGRRPYTTAGGSTSTTFTVTSPTLQAFGAASYNQNTCGAAGGLCQANGAFLLPAGGRGGGGYQPGGLYKMSTGQNPGQYSFGPRTGRHFI